MKILESLVDALLIAAGASAVCFLGQVAEESGRRRFKTLILKRLLSFRPF